MFSIIMTTLYTCSVRNWSSLDESNSSIVKNTSINDPVVFVNTQYQNHKNLNKRVPKSRNNISKIHPQNCLSTLQYNIANTSVKIYFT